MHEARKNLAIEANRIESDAIKAGTLKGNRVIIAEAAGEQHKEAMNQAGSILLDFTERMGRPKEQRLMIELKYVRKADDQKTIKSALLTDLADYGANSEVDYVIALIYDPSHQLPAAVQLQEDL
jgi:hypothetical protein